MSRKTREDEDLAIVEQATAARERARGDVAETMRVWREAEAAVRLAAAERNEAIRRYVEDLGGTVYELAKELGMAQSSLGGMREKGRRAKAAGDPAVGQASAPPSVAIPH